MDTYDFVQLALLAMGGEIKGKTKLQKTMYFLGLLTDRLDDLGYRPHFYGPYSEDVADAVNRLKSVGFVDQTSAGGGSTDELGFEFRRYDYRLTEEGNAIALAKSEKHPEVWERIDRAAKTLKGAEDRNYMQLSVAAKTHFMLKTNSATERDLVKLAHKFGWTVTEGQAKEAAKYLQKLGLLEVVKD
jgi:uncharacterized protein YwgA